MALRHDPSLSRCQGPGPHGPSTSPSIHAIHESKMPTMLMRTYSPIIYIFLSYPQQSLLNSPYMVVDVQEFAPEMGDMKRPVASNHCPAQRPPKIPTTRCLSLERSIQHAKCPKDPLLK